MAMWDMDLYCIVPLVVLILGHWAVLMQGTSDSAIDQMKILDTSGQAL